jgi:hypothetical protein
MNIKAFILAALTLAAIPAAAQTDLWSAPSLGAAPATDDLLRVYDTSASLGKKMTVLNLFTSPTLVTPTLGVATATSLNGLTITTSTGTLTVPNGVVFTGPSATGTAATLAGSETLTNKTFNLSSNTLTSTSLQLNTALSDETGSGAAVFATSPTLVTPTLGVATATSINGLTITTSTGTLTVPNGVTLTGPAASGTAATLAGTETLTNKTLTSAVLGTGLTASGSASNDFSGSTGTFKTSTGLTTIGGGVVGAVQALSGAGAVNLTTVSTHWTTTGADAGTLADGTAGQIKVVIMKVDGGTGTLTPTTASGFTSIVFDDPGDAVTLEFVATIGWVVIGSRGVTF